ncbi:MAG TPA: PKD domain-containing protein [Spirochaetota bacterium]|nr:PKD domain-containing protein [Spirochaetota bacterium]HPI91206.1 PKD domain-containing protein [Spirochaetota bacterium]
MNRPLNMHQLRTIFILLSTLTLLFAACSRGDLSSSGPNGPISISVSTSRESGVAPLSVFFDATGTRGLGLDDDGFFSKHAQYLDATFSWDFDADDHDPDGKYEKASGFLAAHVFEQPGTYRVHLDVYDDLGETASADINITVLPFSGTTYYVANGGSDSNTGLDTDHPFETPGHALSSSILGPDVRVLFRNGDTFYISSMIGVSDAAGPIIIGGYDSDGSTSAKPIIYTTAVNSDWSTVHFYGCTDVRFMDIAVRATEEGSEDPRYPFGVSWNYGCTHMLKYRTEEYHNGGMSMSPGGQYCTVAECEFHNTTQTGYTSSGEGTNDGGAIIGNWVYDKNVNTTEDTEHVFRLQGGSRYFIAHNTFGPNVLVHYDGLTIRGNSDRIVIYRNSITGWVTGIWPQNRNSAEEYQHHCIIDSNLFVGQGLYENDRQGAIAMHARDIVVRNNIIYNYQYGVGIGDDSVVGASRRIKVYNNTFINPSADDTFNAVHTDEACYQIDVKNNLMLDLAGGNPPYTSFLDVWSGSTFQGASDNNLFYGSTWEADPDLFGSSTLAEWQDATGNDLESSIADPQLAGTDYTDADFCRPQAGSPLIDAGEFTPGALDYNGDPRDSSRDIGACEYQ